MTSIEDILRHARDDAQVDLCDVELTVERAKLIASVMKNNTKLCAVLVRETSPGVSDVPTEILQILADGMRGQNFVYTNIINIMDGRNPVIVSDDPDAPLLREEKFHSSLWRIFKLKNANQTAASGIIHKLVNGETLTPLEVVTARAGRNGIEFMLNHAKEKGGWGINDPKEREQILYKIPPVSALSAYDVKNSGNTESGRSRN